MSKKKNTSAETSGERRTKRTTRAGFSKFCAFWGIAFAALLFLVNGILQIVTKMVKVDLNGWMTGIDFVSKLLLLVAVAIPAYGYVANRKMAWRIIYAISIIFYAFFCVFRLF